MGIRPCKTMRQRGKYDLTRPTLGQQFSKMCDGSMTFLTGFNGKRYNAITGAIFVKIKLVFISKNEVEFSCDSNEIVFNVVALISFKNLFLQLNIDSNFK